MDSDTLQLEAEESMQKGIAHMIQEFGAVRTGKASPALIENIDVEAYGSRMKLKELALITTPEPRLLAIQPFDLSTVKDIDRALRESKLGINPAVDGKLIRLPIPELSEERRKELVKGIKKTGEETKIHIRGDRRKAIDEAKKLHKSGAITDDGIHDFEDAIQKLTDKFVKLVEENLAKKEAEIMTV